MTPHFVNIAVEPAKQSRADSFMESITSTAIGFVISLLTWVFTAWAYGIPMTWATNVQITGIFTIVSIIRQFAIRRLFDGKTPWAAIKGKFR